MKRTLILLIFLSSLASAQTASSLFLKSDGVQVSEIKSPEGDLYKKVGHHGPAVENKMSAWRLYFNDSGAIDVYSKSGEQMELLKYLWYPTEEQQKSEGAGCDEYRVGKTVGCGGFALWDGEKEVKLIATEGRTARAGKTLRGCYAEMISYGVPYKGGKVDISVRIDVTRGSRTATVTAKCLGGEKVQFLTGLNCHPTSTVGQKDGAIWTWGIHPADVSQHPIPIGAGLFYNKKIFTFDLTRDFMRLISSEQKSVSTVIVAASVKEKALGTESSFVKYMTSKN